MGKLRRWRAGLLLGSCLAALLALAPPLQAQDPAAAGADTTGTLIIDDPIRALVAPVALYPDPILSAVLQASLFPVDVVQADRFLQKYAADQTLEPSPEWDPALIALLNYPSIITEMNENLDWTEALGDAVYEQLEAVQDAIQDLRMAAYSMGMIATNEVQEVVIEENIVAIRPASPDSVAIPEYDGAALLEALQAEDVAEAAPPGPPVARPEEPAAAEAPAADSAPAADPAPVAEAAPTATATTEVYIEAPAAAPAETYAYAPPAAPTYVNAPVYTSPPPPVYYSEPASPYWGTGAAFAGGAILGGMLGYALADDDDWDWGDNDFDGGDIDIDRDINIEDSNIVIGGSGDRVRRTDTSEVTASVRGRRESGGGATAAPRGERERQGTTVAALPEQRQDRAARTERAREVALPARGREQPARVERGGGGQAQALRAPADRGAVAAVKPPSETRRDAERGQASRQQASGQRAAAPQPQSVARGERDGGAGALAPSGGERQAQAQAQRGGASRGGGGRRR